MSFLTQFTGGATITKTIQIKQSVAGWSPNNYSIPATSAFKRVTCGALTAGALTTIFSKTDGPCEMSQLAIMTVDGAARTMRAVVEVDGGTAFDYTSASFANINQGVLLAGKENSSDGVSLQPIRSASSLVVKVASNIAEVDKFYIDYAYQELR